MCGLRGLGVYAHACTHAGTSICIRGGGGAQLCTGGGGTLSSSTPQCIAALIHGSRVVAFGRTAAWMHGNGSDEKAKGKRGACMHACRRRAVEGTGPANPRGGDNPYLSPEVGAAACDNKQQSPRQNLHHAVPLCVEWVTLTLTHSGSR